jgi:hypothetical protein
MFIGFVDKGAETGIVSMDEISFVVSVYASLDHPNPTHIRSSLTLWRPEGSDLNSTTSSIWTWA